jgi:hypothetical protein
MNSNSNLDMDEFHKINDMAMVTFLKLRGHTAQDVQWNGSTCFWVFRVTDSLLDLIDDFVDGKALVEPREYNRMFSDTKREFYDNPGRPTRERRD